MIADDIVVEKVDLNTLMRANRSGSAKKPATKRKKKEADNKKEETTENKEEKKAETVTEETVVEEAAAGAETKIEAAKPKKKVPFTKRYAPKSLTEVKGQEDVVVLLQKLTENLPESAREMPNMIFFGPPGVGKTTCVDLLIQRLYGGGAAENKAEKIQKKDQREQCVLKLNASDERGIQVVRTRIKTFASLSAPTGAPFRLVVLDECDNMTNDAQSALRYIMEHYTHNTRFVLLCNYESRLLAPIVSRCMPLRFVPLSAEKMLEALQRVSAAEKWAASESVLKEIVRQSRGDMRNALTIMQSLLKLWGDLVSEEHVGDVCGQVPFYLLRRLASFLTDEKKTINDVFSLCERLMMREGFCGDGILRGLADILLDEGSSVEDATAEQNKKTRMCIIIAEADCAIAKKADDFLQVLNACVKIRSLFLN